MEPGVNPLDLQKPGAKLVGVALEFVSKMYEDCLRNEECLPV